MKTISERMTCMTNQYANFYDNKLKCIPMAEASYIPCLNTDNRYITALPPVRDTKELFRNCTNTSFPGLPPEEEFKQLTEKEQLVIINRLNKATICLPYYPTIEESIDRCLTDSYERRVSIESQRPYRQYTFRDDTQDCYQRMEITEMSNAPTGFCLLGRSGCGKTTGVNIVLRKYPRVIVHNPDTLQQTVQIPVLLVHMSENNNFNGLYRCIGRQIDLALQNTNSIYENELGKSRDSLSVKFSKFCNLIRVFHIGMLIIDEIELIDTTHTKEGTLETFMSLSNQTGIAIGAIGTEDAFSKLFRHPRATRRLGDLISADNYCSSLNNIKRILQTLYAYLPEKAELTNDCLDAYYKESNGTIAYLTKIFVGVIKETIKLKSKKKPNEITPTLIAKVAKKCLAGKQFMDRNCPENIIIEDEEYSQNLIRELLSKKNEEGYEVPAPPKIDYMPTLNNIVKMAIHAFPDTNYSDEDIESSLHTVLNKIPDNNTQAAITATFIELKRRAEAKIKRNAKKKQQEKSVVDLHALKASLPVSTDV